MAGKQFKLSIVVDATTASATKGLAGLGKAIGGIATAGAVLGTAVVGGAALAGGALARLAIDAAPLAGIEDAFTGIAEASGKSSKEMLDALKKGSAGMITQRDLMQKYNLAASLVTDQFANQLPDAMGYLTKVAAGTGEDMGYMLDSLVRGVGRLSPMILDNLGIQVDLNEAYEAFAPTIGKTVSELTKQEQQTALMNQVMEKLAENTANMPEVAGSAAQGLAALKTKFMDLKDSAGQHLLPVLSIILDKLNLAADKIFPKIEGAFETLAQVIEAFLSGAPGDYPWEDIFPPWLADIAYKLSEWFEGGGEAVGGLIEEMKLALAGGWPGIVEMLKGWGLRFWDWVTETVVPLAMEKLQEVADAIKAWAESPDTQAQLAAIGETTGRGLVEGVRALVGVTATWTPIMIEMSAAVATAAGEAALPAFKAIAEGLATGFVTGLADAIGLQLPDAIKSAITSALSQIMLLGIPGGALLPFLPGFQFGGTMPGPTGQPGLAVLHGGERVTPAGRSDRSLEVLTAIRDGIQALVAKDSIIVVETSDAGATRDALLSLGDRAWAVPSGA